MLPGELWQHQERGIVVRIEVSLSGLLSFSVLRKGQWLMHRDPWDEQQFRRKFKRITKIPKGIPWLH